MHAPYACRHSGVCCSSGWAIAVEHTRAQAIGLLRGDRSWLWPAPGAPADVAGTLALADTGHCVFHQEGCEIQRLSGHDALPTACQHFPREVLIDGRGVSVTLSHYCPTALDLLLDHVGPVEIVEGPPSVPTGDPEGLDARDVLPPLLTAGVLMDLEGYSAWEAHMIQVLTAADGRTPDDALAMLERDLALIQRWRPGGRSLADEVSCLALGNGTAGPGRRQPVGDGAADPGASQAHGPVAGVDISRSDAAAKAVSPGTVDLTIRRYLAARAFGSWMAYQAGGIAAVLRHLRFALALLRARLPELSLQEAIRQTDLQILHLLPRDVVVENARAPRS
jgi:hypothetical protein